MGLEYSFHRVLARFAAFPFTDVDTCASISYVVKPAHKAIYQFPNYRLAVDFYVIPPHIALNR